MAGDVINYTPAPTLKAFIKDYAPGQLFYDWVLGPVGCLPADSEFLTPTGWRRMDDWREGDQVAVWSHETRSVAFEAARWVKIATDESFHRFDSGSLEMELSSEHTVPYYDYRGAFQTCLAGDMAVAPSRRTIPTTWELDREDFPVDDEFIRLRVAFSADGHIPAKGKQVSITVRKERKKARLRELLAAVSFKWSERTYVQRPTETIFVFEWHGVRKSLNWVWGLSSDQLAVVVDECLRWDGLNDHAEKRFYTSVKSNADAVQFAAHSCGFRATIKSYDDPRSETWATMYTVAIRATDNPKNRAMVRAETRISRVQNTDGFKYCFHTSTGFFVARCNDTIFITGNSGKTTSIFFKLIYLAGLQAPGTDGVRRTRAVVVRNTMPQLKDTTLASWGYWFKDGIAGEWKATANTFVLRFGGKQGKPDIECEVLFRPLDTADDIARVLSLEVTFAIIDEFVQIPKQIIDALSARLGRYPSMKDGGATNWGMWGSSNPDTEDSWWYDYLHDETTVERAIPGEDPDDRAVRRAALKLTTNVRYFVQPSGLGPDAENLENLPGGRGYYDNQIKGKSQVWIKQFIEAEWGFSVAGKPVVAAFKPDLHVAKSPLRHNPLLPIVVGFDPGLGGSAFIFGQQDPHGRLLVLGELVQEGIGAQRLITERFKPYLRRRFPDAHIIIAPDPAAAQRSSNDERAVVSAFKNFEVRLESSNRLPLRLDAIDHYATLLTEEGPALQIDAKECPILIRALKGGWRYAVDAKKNAIKGDGPEKNAFSHPGDAFGYLARFFYKEGAQEARYSPGKKIFTPPRTFGSTYHFR